MGRIAKVLFDRFPSRVDTLYKGQGLATRLLRQIGHSYLHGYNLALRDDNPEQLARQLDPIAPEFRGFAYEGAGTGLTLLDYLTPWNRSRLQTFLAGPGGVHTYAVHVGAGWVFARLRRFSQWPFTQLDPFMRWFIIDGFGAHDGFFYWNYYIQKQTLPKGLSDYQLRVFDQGFGRSIWFMAETNIRSIGAIIARFALNRQPDLWSGVGAACSFAGGVDEETVKALRSAASRHQARLAVGATYGARVRQLADIPAAHTELACNILCGLSAREAANINLAAMDHLPQDGPVSSFEVWRQRIEAYFLNRQVE